jgi:predicted dehydrogenase
MGLLDSKEVRYAVVGLGHISQTAILPCFQHCKSSKLTALVSNDNEKRSVLSQKYGVKNTYSYNEYEACLESGEVDAVYIALPNHLHKEYTVRAAKAGIHVLCEKPMAVTPEDCEQMIQACDDNQVRLMIAYRLHFEAANLEVIHLIHDTKILGEPKLFQSTHSQAANYPNIRTLPTHQGGGPTYDIGVYDINASRYIFQDEPLSVFAENTRSHHPSLKEIEESVSIVMKFPNNRLASIIYSFRTTDTDTYRVIGTKGDLILNPAYTYHGDKQLTLTIEENKDQRTFQSSDQFAAEVEYFSACLLSGQTPEPSGLEGLADIRIVDAILKSAQERRVIELSPIHKKDRPNLKQKIELPPIEPPETVHAQKPSKEKAA